MKKSLTFILSLSAVILSGGVVSCRTAVDSAVPSAASQGPDGFGAYRNNPGPQAMPYAQIYRTSGDFDSYVPVTVNPVDGKLVSYPAPGDITGASMPVVLRDGWLLDRRGISPDTRFVRYTYSEYHDLSQAPSPEELVGSIIPDAVVTEIVSLPYKVGEATPAKVDSLIAAGLPRCEVTYKR